MKIATKIIMLGFVIVAFGCSRKQMTTTKLIDLKNASVLMTDSANSIYISLIKAFPCQHKDKDDIGKNRENLYICIEHTFNDTLLVFEPCSEVPKYLKTDEFSDDLRIIKSDIEMTHPTLVYVDVPPTFVMPKKFKFVFSHIGYFKE